MDDLKAGDIPVTVTTMFGYKSQQPLVCLGWGDTMPTQLTTAKAREIAMMLIEAAESAEQDGFIFRWAIDKAGVGEVQAAGLLGDFRKYRAR